MLAMKNFNISLTKNYYLVTEYGIATEYETVLRQKMFS